VGARGAPVTGARGARGDGTPYGGPLPGAWEQDLRRKVEHQADAAVQQALTIREALQQLTPLTEPAGQAP